MNHVYYTRRACVLQWGRNLSVAEGRAPCTAPRYSSALQWGRNLSVAEGLGRGAGRRVGMACFNGAATFRLRKGTCG